MAKTRETDEQDIQAWLRHMQTGSHLLLRAMQPGSSDADMVQALSGLRAEWLAALEHGMGVLSRHLGEQDHWLSALKEQLSMLREELRRTLDDREQQLPPDLQWLQTWMESLSTDPGDNLASAILGGLGHWPALGIGSRQMERLRQLQDSLAAAAEAIADHNGTLMTMLDQAITDWQRRLSATTTDAAPDQETLFEYWLASLDTAYERMLESDRHTSSLAAMNAALLKVRKDALPLLEPWFHSAGLATARDLAGTQNRMHEWRRRQEQELASLREAVAALEARVGKQRDA